VQIPSCLVGVCFEILPATSLLKLVSGNGSSSLVENRVWSTKLQVTGSSLAWCSKSRSLLVASLLIDLFQTLMNFGFVIVFLTWFSGNVVIDAGLAHFSG